MASERDGRGFLYELCRGCKPLRQLRGLLDIQGSVGRVPDHLECGCLCLYQGSLAYLQSVGAGGGTASAHLQHGYYPGHRRAAGNVWHVGRHQRRHPVADGCGGHSWGHLWSHVAHCNCDGLADWTDRSYRPDRVHWLRCHLLLARCAQVWQLRCPGPGLRDSWIDRGVSDQIHADRLRAEVHRNSGSRERCHHRWVLRLPLVLQAHHFQQARRRRACRHHNVHLCGPGASARSAANCWS
mmetsp:Transcript_31463/g.56443  ORF Transcript_31463/g.56443 Transcript_31463/m.56443 type:complete len:240 (+) Transcript_31463:2962-3681(+)